MDLEAISNRAANCMTYKFGMADADTLAHYDAPAMIFALSEVESLHKPMKIWESDRSYSLVCRSCSLSSWPCATATALGILPGDPEPTS